MRPITLSVPTVRGGLLRVDIDPGDAKPYFAGRQLLVDYGDLDLTEVPAAAALVPALGIAVPVGVATGVPVSSPVLDLDLVQQVRGIADRLHAIYPQLEPAGFDLLGPVVAGNALFTHRDRAVLLYSGGLDSVAALLRNWADVDCLLTVCGLEARPPDGSDLRRHRMVSDAAPARAETGRVVARTNARQLLDELRLNRRFDRGFPGTDWWASVHAGLALTTLAAPLCSVLGLGKVIVAGAHGAARFVPFGSSADLHELVRWAGSEVVHDSLDLDMQQKIQHVVAPWMWQGGELMLAVCAERDPEGISVNCGTCEPCMRAVTALLVAGQDPAQAGLPVSAWSLMNWRERMTSGQVRLDADALTEWSLIQRAIETYAVDDSYGTAGYLTWLEQFDLRWVARARARTDDAVGGMNTVRYQAERVARHLPRSLRRPRRRPPG